MKTLLVLMLFVIGLAFAGAAQEKIQSLEGVDVIPAEFTGTKLNFSSKKTAPLQRVNFWTKKNKIHLQRVNYKKDLFDFSCWQEI